MVYKIEFEKFFSFSFSLDCLIFGYKDGKIQVLLIKRAMEPFNGMWAVPGDLIYPDEDLPEAASRILVELTSVKGVSLHQGQVFGHPKRHPQGRVITCSYFALVKIDSIDPKADSWADEVKWVPIDEVGDLAFDHNQILEGGYENFKAKLRSEPIAFDLLEEKFTLNDLQLLYEYAFRTKMDKANFRKKIKTIPLVNLKVKQTNVSHRPANQFRFDYAEYDRLTREGELIFRM